MNKPIIFLLILVLIKSIIWGGLTPIFQAPDEHTHFGIIQYIGEKNHHPGKLNPLITSKELIAVGEITNFNWMDSHPVWQGLPDDWQEKIKSLDPSLKNDFVHHLNQGGQKLPPLYYYLSFPAYKIMSWQNFLIRFFSLRLVSVLLGVLTVYFSFKTARIFFAPSWSLAIASLVAFQPTLSVIFSTITYDSLAVTLTSLFTYLSLKYLKANQSKYLFFSLLTVVLCVLTKTQLICLLLPWAWLLLPKHKRYLLLSLPVLLSVWFYQPARFVINQIPLFFSHQPLLLLKQYLVQNYQAFSAQIFPWYWGVFGWLEKTMPLWTYRVLKIIVALGLIGLIKIKKTKTFWWLILLNLSLVLIVFANDFLIFTQNGAGFGVQGRYFLPGVISQMMLLMFGLNNLVPKKIAFSLPYIIISLSLLLNIIGLFSLWQYFWA